MTTAPQQRRRSAARTLAIAADAGQSRSTEIHNDCELIVVVTDSRSQDGANGAVTIDVGVTDESMKSLSAWYGPKRRCKSTADAALHCATRLEKTGKTSAATAIRKAVDHVRSG